MRNLPLWQLSLPRVGARSKHIPSGCFPEPGKGLQRLGGSVPLHIVWTPNLPYSVSLVCRLCGAESLPSISSTSRVVDFTSLLKVHQRDPCGSVTIVVTTHPYRWQLLYPLAEHICWTNRGHATLILSH